jgi:putative DNA methylase
MSSSLASKSFIEVQFPIGPLSLESYIERDAKGAKALSSLGKWWGSKPLVLTRAIILGSVFPAADDPERWPEDLAVFLRCMTLDNAGMWKRKTDPLPAMLCWPQATATERAELFEIDEQGEIGDMRWRRRGADRQQRERLEKRVFFTLDYVQQRDYCCRVEQIDGPPEESWTVINSYLGTTATTLPQLIEQLSMRRYGKRLRVGDAFSGMGSIPFEAAELGCDVFASDLNPVACLLTWGALNLVGGTNEIRATVHAEQKRIYDEVDAWILENGFETSEEGWRAEAYLYCVEMVVPEWDDWKIPICPSWVIAPKTKIWVELVPIESEKRFGFQVRSGGAGNAEADKGTKQGSDIVCPPALWDLFRQQGRHQQMPRTVPYNQLIENAGGLRRWENADLAPRPGDVLQERLFCIRWRTPDRIDERGRERRGDLVYREPRSHDLDVEQQVLKELRAVFDDWQVAGWTPGWRIEPGQETTRLTREKGWTYWHHLFTPRQLLMAGEYSRRISECEPETRAALSLVLGMVINYSSRICHWLPTQGGGIGGTKWTFYNQALNTFPNYPVRTWAGLHDNLQPKHLALAATSTKSVSLIDARAVSETCSLWITDPPYADAVNYEELSEYFLAWYVPHLKAAFPAGYTDSMRTRAVKGEDAPFRVAMAECYRNLAQHMPEDGMQVLMFTHKSTDVWEDLALIMWAAGLQVKQVWSVATETPGLGVRSGNYVQATYNMVLRKRTGDKLGFVDFITPAVNKRVQEVITRMRESQIETGLARCGYTDTDYLLAAQAAAAEVVTGFASIDGVDLEAELRTPNNQRGRSALRTLMDNAKRTATDFLVPPAMDRAIKKASGGDPYQFWRQFSPEEKFLLKGLEGEAQGVFKLGVFQDLGRAYGLADYESLLGPTRANDTRTVLPEELPRPDALRFDEVPAADRGLWRYSPTRHLYHALKLLADGAEVERAVKHLVDVTDFRNLRTTRLAAILAYLQEMTAHLPHWADYQDALTQLAIGVEHHRD